ATGSNDELRIEIHGSRGAIYFNLMDPNWLWVYDTKDPQEPVGGLRGFKKIETIQRYPEPDNVAIYQKIYQDYLSLYQKLYGTT
ncbi:unnamed protein product, partial [marine sediment metagenome]